MTFYEEFLDSLFASISDKHREELSMSLITEKNPSKETEHGEWLRGVYFACKEVKKISQERESKYITPNTCELRKLRTVYCPKCGNGFDVYIEGFPNIARCVCGNVFEYPIGKTKKDK